MPLAALALAVIVATPTAMLASAPAVHGFGIADAGRIAGRDFVDGEVIVGLYRGMPEAAADTVARAGRGRVARRLGGPDPIALVRFADEPRARQALATLAKQPGVRFIERNGIVSIPPMPATAVKHDRGRATVRGSAVSSDPGTAHQWHLTVIRHTAPLGSLTRTPPTIAVIDSGVDYTHVDLSGKVIRGKNCVDDTMDPFDDHGHGTHVAGIAAATAGNGVDGDGVSRSSKILAVKVLDATGFGTFFDIVCGMRYARNAVTAPAMRIGNLSVAGPKSMSLAAEVDAWMKAGKVLVAAAGNGNDTGTGTFNVDANFAFRVMATEENDCRASFSAFSPAAEPARFNIAAPGFDISSTLPGQAFGTMSGTSMAAPMVAGAAALVWGETPGLSRAELVTRIVDAGKPIACGFAVATRRLDVRQALLGTAEVAIIGRVLDGATGKAVASATPTVRALDGGAALLATDVTNEGGSYEIKAAGLAGTGRTLAFTAPGYISDDTMRSPVTVVARRPTGPFTDVVLRQRQRGVVQVALDWKTTQPDTAAAGARTIGWDLDLLLQPPGMSRDWVGPGPHGDLARRPFYRVFRESFSDYEPVEALAIAPAAPDGRYRILVRRFTGPDPLGLNASRAQVRVFDSNVAVAGMAAPTCPASTPFWHVANIDKAGSSYVVRPVNICRSRAP